MPEPGPLLGVAGPLPRDAIRDAVRRASPFEPPIRVLAEDVLGADSRIDFVAVDPSGRIVLVLIGDEGDDGGLLTRGLAQRAWVRPRLADWLKLGPQLEIQAQAPVQVALLCPSFSPETRAAAEDLGAEILQLYSCRSIRHDGGALALVERISPPVEAPFVASAPFEAPRPAPASRFRSGLSEEDLGLTPDEIRDFE